MKEIYLINYGIIILVDEIDYHFCLSFQFRLIGEGYIAVRFPGKETSYYLHRLIAQRAGLNIDCEIDHKDRNKYNCQRSNLRPATRIQNCQNSGVHSNNSTGIKGVDFKDNKYRVRIRINGIRYYLGTFDTLKEADHIYREAEKKYFGEFARRTE